MTDILNMLADSWLGHLMRDIFWMWPFMENLHFIGLCMLMGGLLVIDLRVLGVSKAIPVKPIMWLIPFVMVGFTINLLTGIAFFCGDPFRYTYNTAFQWKMAFVVLAGLNALWFWFGEHGKMVKLGPGDDADIPAKLIAAFSLALWVGVIIMGRMIPYLE